MKRRLAEPMASTAFMVFVAVMAHGLWFPWLGLHWDDWYLLWTGYAQGTEGFLQGLSHDRPWAGYTFALGFWLTGNSVVAQHLYVVMLRIAAGLAALWMFRSIWPERSLETALMAVLATTYPGALHQLLPAFQNAWIRMVLLPLSLGCTAVAVRSSTARRRYSATLVALSSQLAVFLLGEYYVGTEALRFLLIVCVLSGSARWRTQIVRGFKLWMPYLLVAVGFLVYRVFFFTSLRRATDVGYAMSAIVEHPIWRTISMGKKLLHDFMAATLFAWFVPAFDRLEMASGAIWCASSVVLLVGASVTLYYCRWLRCCGGDAVGPGAVGDPRSWGRNAVLIGVISFPAAYGIVLFAGRNLRLLESADRYTLPVLLPVVLVVVGLVSLAIQDPWRKRVFAGLVGLSVATHFANAAMFARDWQRRRDVWWQLSWRAPKLSAGTNLLLYESRPEIMHTRDYAIWVPGSLLYDDGSKGLVVTGGYLREPTLELLSKSSRKTQTLRQLSLTHDYGKSLVVVAPTDRSCLRVIDGGRIELPAAAESALVAAAARYSDIRRIDAQAEGVVPDHRIFGREPEHTWCYYFQQADLAAQRGSWEQVSELGRTAAARGLAPEDPSEWLPLLQAAVAIGDCRSAERILAELAAQNFALPSHIETECSRLTGDQDGAGPDR